MHLDVTPETVNRYLAEAGASGVLTVSMWSLLPDILDFCRTYLSIDRSRADPVRRLRTTQRVASPPISTGAR